MGLPGGIHQTRDDRLGEREPHRREWRTAGSSPGTRGQDLMDGGKVKTHVQEGLEYHEVEGGSE